MKSEVFGKMFRRGWRLGSGRMVGVGRWRKEKGERGGTGAWETGCEASGGHERKERERECLLDVGDGQSVCV